MSTLNFKKVGSLVKVEHSESGLDRTIDANDIEFSFPNDGTTSVSVFIKGRKYNLSAITDIQIDGVAVTDQADFETQIATVFPEAGGTASPTLPVLAAPDDSQWTLSITNAGALVTEQLTNTVGASALTSITLTAPDNTEWTVSVNNSGVLTTTAV